jgi:kinesin family protein 11
MSSKIGNKIQVVVRCRPLTSKELSGSQQVALKCNLLDNSVKINFGPNSCELEESFRSSLVFGVHANQAEIFDSSIRPIVTEALAGFNSSILAYGRTGSGKTYTMEGDVVSTRHAGIIPRAVKMIFDHFESCGTDFSLLVSHLEICKLS